MKKHFLILLLLLSIVQTIFGQHVNSYNIEFIGAATKPIFPINVFNECSCIFQNEVFQNQPLTYKRTILEKNTIILTKEDFIIFEAILSELIDLYAINFDDSSFNKFVITKEYSLSKEYSLEKKEISRFNENNGLFYISLYKKLKENKFPIKLLEAIYWHITFLEEQVYDKKIFEE